VPIELLTAKGYRRRRNPEQAIDGVPDVWWCIACNRCLPARGRSAFCFWHKWDYTRQRRKIRDRRNQTLRISRDDLRQLRDLIEKVETSRAELRRLSTQEPSTPTDQSAIKGQAKQDQALDALVVFVRRDLPHWDPARA